MFKILVAAFAIAFISITAASAQEDCPSQATIKISSIDYPGAFRVELRMGTRPGSEVADSTTMEAGGQYVFYNVCPGTYFFAIGPETSDVVSVTNYFNVTFDGENYSNPEISVFYSSDTTSAQQVGSARKSDL